MIEVVAEIEASPAVPAEASWAEALRSPFAALAGGDAQALEAVWEVAGRRRRRQRSEPLECAAVLEAPAHDPGRRVEAERVSRHLSRLPAPQREAVALRHVEGYSYREIGRITGVPTFTAASRCRLGLSRLRRLMEEPR